MKELETDETTCHPNEVVVQKCMTSKKSRRKGRKTQVPWEERCKNNDDVEFNALHNGKGKMIQTNVESDSSSFSEDEELRLALQNLVIFQYPLQFGEGTSKSFLEGTNSRHQLNIEEGINEDSLEYFHIPNNIRINTLNL
ncbi:hypothetical protein MTR_3g051390 [Medicago truncatula]|uniref:Uncharacterized protein n=1 Tax=Medicago truncatula TaxID=3880 RepID=G7IXM0_MEDTR|nr:hypothetical protein MTR_3g051390 [Medicago truncatula]